ncbi:MAG TPA: LPS-assembly protein LptD [Casimicrobiaceae bacterium]|nr:LPS-assembly protein LptD [Casimicrobiaceae bacterium]
MPVPADRLTRTLVGVSLLALAHGVCAQELALRLSRTLETPAPATGSATAGPGAPRVPRTPGSAPAGPLTLDVHPRGALFLRADRLEGTRTEVTAQGGVELRAREQTVLADWLNYNTDTDEIHARGNVVLRQGFDWITGPELKFKRDTETGYFTAPRFNVTEVNAKGSASEIRFKGPEQYEASNATYTTCVAARPDWYLTSEELEIDQSRKVATAHHAAVYFKDVPIGYAPWLEFPLSNERKSGFLTPILGSSGTRGFEGAAPYYLNLAPNYDATLVPRYMTKRGLQVGGQFRYLLGDADSPFGQAAGEINAEFLPHDRVTDTNRYGLSWKHNEQFTPNLAGFLDLQKVSDDTYFADLADRIAITSQRTLPRDAGLVYTQGPWQFLARAQSYQTLQDPNLPVTPPYNRLPQLLANLSDTQWLGLTWSGFAEYANFSQAALAPTADRLVLYPTAAFERRGSSWFFNARAGVHMRQYDLQKQTDATPEKHPSVAVPITSLDGGLIFERDMEFAQSKFTQTLEPRAFYVYIPYRRQDQTPAFDTAIDDFNFSQLFAENRYLGNDRIGDANQLSLALTSRFLDRDTGAERLRLAVGQRYYFEQQRVTLNETPRSANSSDFLLSAEGRLSDAWAMSSLLQYNFDQGQVERLNLGARYTPGAGRVLNATWRYTRNLPDPTTGLPEQIKQVDLSGEWPVGDHWTLLGRWNYSLPDHKTLEAVAGIEYNGDCWVLRVVGQRLTTTTQTTSNSVFIQLELNGLARVGTSPLELLRRSVPGYVPVNDPSLRRTDRSLDPLPEF